MQEDEVDETQESLERLYHMKNFYTHGRDFDFTRYFHQRVGSKDSVKLPKRKA